MDGGGFVPLAIGRRLWITPASLDAEPAPGRIPIRIEGGRVFGTGTHPTTQLCLLALERHVTRDMTVIDLGTGTGILAIAAVKLGAGHALAVDVDDEAVRAARANAAANGVGGTVAVERGSLAEMLAGRWQGAPARLVVVNILAHVIVELFEQGLARVVEPGGLLALSGFQRIHSPDIRGRLQSDGLELLAEERSDPWLCVVARRSQDAVRA